MIHKYVFEAERFGIVTLENKAAEQITPVTEQLEEYC